MDKKFETFLEIAKALNHKGIVPILYGSLGLYRIVGELDEIGDIDITIQNKYLEDKFPELIEIMAGIGYSQDKKYPHEFTKGEGQIGFEPESELIEDTGVKTEELKTSKINGAEFQELEPKHYLIIYRKTLDKWNEKIDKIKRKIEALEKISND
ncbi:hypothetical protein L0244_14620 [bacterium]|nr:hypothetical protein [bacterium]